MFKLYTMLNPRLTKQTRLLENRPQSRLFIYDIRINEEVICVSFCGRQTSHLKRLFIARAIQLITTTGMMTVVVTNIQTVHAIILSSHVIVCAIDMLSSFCALPKYEIHYSYYIYFFLIFTPIGSKSKQKSIDWTDGKSRKCRHIVGKCVFVS